MIVIDVEKPGTFMRGMSEKYSENRSTVGPGLYLFRYVLVVASRRPASASFWHK